MGVAHLEIVEPNVVERNREWMNLIDGNELYHKKFEDRPDVIQDILPQGTMLLAGKPKSKKTWFCLDLALSVAEGGKMLNEYSAIRGQVLYIDLEMGQRRVHNRMKLMRREPPKGQLAIVSNWPRIGHGCTEWLETWMGMYPYTRLVVIDTLIEIRPLRIRTDDPYQADKALTQELSSFAQQHQIAIVLVHHTRKARADDMMDEISGTFGLIGGVDNYMVLSRSQNRQNGGVIHLGGRDIRVDDPINIEWDEAKARWGIGGTPTPKDLSPQQQEVLLLLEAEPGLLPAQIGEKLNRPKPTVHSTLNRLKKGGLLIAEQGRYYVSQ